MDILSDDEQKLSGIENASGLPPLEEVREANTMRIIVVNTLTFPKEVLKTSMFVVDHNGNREPLYAPIVKIIDERVKGFMPSKVWWNGDTESFELLYYINPALPKATKPFKDNTYLMYTVCMDDSIVEYDVSVRIFIDQVKTNPLGMMHVFMFGDESYSHIAMESKELEIR